MDTEQLIREIYDHSDRESRLTTWELDFMENINDQYKLHGSVSNQQHEVLEAIWTKLSTRGFV